MSSYSLRDVLLTIGTDRDPGRWKLDPMMQERRRSVFWVLYLLDNYYVCLTLLSVSFDKVLKVCLELGSL